MYSLTIENINIGFARAVELLKSNGVKEDSRNGPVLRLPAPILIEHKNPLNRYLLSEKRDANPFFHLMELKWMLDGSNDLKPLLMYNPGMAQYSDDGSTLRGTAYGYRWRHHFCFDQLEKIITGLKKDPSSRRYVMSMWDPTTDLVNCDNSKDLACNLQVIFSPNGGKIDMTVTNRSNDLIYGCLGSNVFHFSGLLEYVSWRTGIPVGSYYQFSTNLHIYTENEASRRCLEGADVYIPTLNDDWFQMPYFRSNDVEMAVELLNLEQAYRLFKGIDHELPSEPDARKAARIPLLKSAIDIVDKVKHLPTRLACKLWLERRLRKLQS